MKQKTAPDRIDAQTEVRRPAPLRPGDTIGVAAPGGTVKKTAIADAVAWLESCNFNIFIPDNLFETHRYMAGDDLHRAGQLNALFAAESVDAIWCARGGYGSMRILPHLDPDAIPGNPKLLIGFSDVTALLATLWDRWAFPGIHGPVLTTLMAEGEAERLRLIDILCNSSGWEWYPDNAVTVFPGRAAGIVAGGNLATLCHLLGTPYMPSFAGCILFLEDVNEPLYKIDRMLTQMALSHAFDGLSGIVLGQFSNCGDASSVIQVFAERFQDSGIPMIANAPFGHGERNRAFPVGVSASLDAESMRLTFSEPLFC